MYVEIQNAGENGQIDFKMKAASESCVLPSLPMQVPWIIDPRDLPHGPVYHKPRASQT